MRDAGGATRNRPPLPARTALCCAAALCVALLFPRAAQADVAVRIGDHSDYTRLVFDFAHTTAYRVAAQAGKITLTFTTREKLVLPATGDEKLITAFSSTRPDAGTATLAISVPKGATAKDYRLDDKIVLDIYAPKKRQEIKEPPPQKNIDKKIAEKNAVEKKLAAEKKIAEKQPLEKTSPAPTTDEPTGAQPAHAKEQAAPLSLVSPHPKAVSIVPARPLAQSTPAPAQEKTPAPATPPQPAPAPTPAPPAAVSAAPPAAEHALLGAAGLNTDAIIVDKPQAEEAKQPEPAPEPARAPTVITISSLEQTRLAVFVRFNTLWIVLDNASTGALEPAVSGPDAGILGAAKTLKFRGGIAFRYLLPPKTVPSVEKQGLTWRISLSARADMPASAAHLNVDFDKTSGRARLMAQIEGAGDVLQVKDPDAGDTLDIIATSDAATRISQLRRFVDVDVLQSALGMVVRPLSDDIKVRKLDNFIIISAPRGIAATAAALAGPLAVRLTNAVETPGARLFDFPNWRQGGIAYLDLNISALENKAAAAASQDDRTALLMKMALLYFANGFGQEAVGVLRLVAQEDAALPKNPNFIALRGAAEALAGHYDAAEADLTNPLIAANPEVKMWLGYTAAATGRWHMAESNFPQDNYLLLEYPPDIAVPFTIYMAESALRLGRLDTANKLLYSLDAMRNQTDPHYSAAIDYLKGEAARQAGNDARAQSFWAPVAMGLDRLYHAKASLALTTMKLQDKKISLKQAIENIDNLRFAWRGDGLEVQILHTLGKLKVKDNQFLSGLEDMKTAARLSADLKDDPQPITDDMTNALVDLFVGGGMKNVSPLEAVSVYHEFSAMLPAGETGAKAALNLADSLIGMDLLGKAEALLEEQLKNAAVPQDSMGGVGVKLAAVYLLDNQPKKALAALDETASAPVEKDDADKRALLKARAYSQLGQTDDAIAALGGLASDDALHLKADIFWRAARWGEAAQAIGALLPAASVASLNPSQAQMVLNDAVAYKLAGDAQGLAALRTRFATAMNATQQASAFGVVTRQNGQSALADRATILKVAGEVDMFKSFLNSYKSRAAKDAPTPQPNQ